MRARYSLALLALGAATPQDSRSFQLAEFDRIRVDGPFEVSVTTGTTPRAVATGARRALDRLNVRTEGGTVIVSAGAERWDPALPPPRIAIGARALRTVALNGSGSLTVSGVRAPAISLVLNGSGMLQVDGIDGARVTAMLSGTGRATLAGRADVANLRSLGAGTLDADAFTVRDLALVAESSGATRARATRHAGVTAVGDGRVEVAGTAECAIRGRRGAAVRCGSGGEREAQ